MKREVIEVNQLGTAGRLVIPSVVRKKLGFKGNL